MRLAELARTLKSMSFAPEAREELAAIDAQLKKLGYDAAAHESARRLELEGRASQDKRLQLEQAKSALVPLEREINSLKISIENNQKHLTTLIDELKLSEEKLGNRIRQPSRHQPAGNRILRNPGTDEPGDQRSRLHAQPGGGA